MTDGYIVRVVPMLTYTFSSLQHGTTQLITLAQTIEAGAFDEVDLELRFHTGTLITTSASQWFTVSLNADAKTQDDPTQTFSTTIASFTTPAGGLTLPFTTVIPAGIVNGNAFGTHLSVTLLAQQQNPNAMPLVAVISADLIFKGCDPADLPMRKGAYMGYRI